MLCARQRKRDRKGGIIFVKLEPSVIMVIAFRSTVESPQSVQSLFKSIAFGSLSSAAMADKQNKLLSTVM